MPLSPCRQILKDEGGHFGRRRPLPPPNTPEGADDRGLQLQFGKQEIIRRLNFQTKMNITMGTKIKIEGATEQILEMATIDVSVIIKTIQAN